MKKHRFLFSALMATVMMAMSPQRMWADDQITLTYLDGLAGFSANEGPAKLIDGDTNTKWCSRWDDDTVPYIIFKTSQPARLTGYSMVHGNDTYEFQYRAWRGWTIYGANFVSDSEATEESTAWTVVDRQSGFYYDDTYSFSDLTCKRYQYYKLVVDDMEAFFDEDEDNYTRIQQMAEVYFTFFLCDHDDTFTDHPATEPTTDAHGCVAYKTCDLCGEALDADGNVIDDPVIHNFNDSHVCTVCGKLDPSFDPRLSALTLKGGVTATFTDEGSHPWVVTTEGESLNSNALPATYVPGLRSNIVGVNFGTSTTVITLNSERDFELSFKAYCNGEDRCDYMQIFVDGSTTHLCRLHEYATSYTFNQTMTAGTHTLKLYYKKDSSADRGYDSGIIYEFNATAPCDVHTWGDWTETKAATCTETGSRKHTCSVCDKTESEPLAALGHNIEEVPAAAVGLCDNPGHSAYYHCTRCNKKYADAAGTQPTLPSVLINGHAGTIVDGTCSVCGLTGDFAPLSDDGYYELSTADDLRWFAAFANNSAYRTANARLMNDIDAGCSESNQWVPMGNNLNYLGNFDGNGKKVSGLYYDGTESYIGFFGSVGNYDYPGMGSVKDLTVDGYFCSTNGNVGGIAGYSYSDISGCTNLATIIGKSYVGGIAGNSNGKSSVLTNVSNCHNHGTITGTNTSHDAYAGGIVGYAENTNFSNCTNDASVSGHSEIGGIISRMYGYGDINNCHNSGSLTATSINISNNLGGILGSRSAEWGSSIPFNMTGCSNTGTVTGAYQYVGGLIGAVYYVSFTIRDCYNRGAVTNNTTNSDQYTGGVIGYLDVNSVFENVYSAAPVAIPNATNISDYGGFMGYCNSGKTVEFRNCYYDNELTSFPFCNDMYCTVNPSSVYGGKSTAEFASGEVAWLLNGSSDTDPAWYQAIGVDAYPTLEQNPYTIVHYNSTEGYNNTLENFASLEFADATAYEALLKRTATELTYTRTFSEEQVGKWLPLYVPFGMQYSDWQKKYDVAELHNVHQYTDEDGNLQSAQLEFIRLKEGASTVANTPYLIRAKVSGEIAITIANAVLARSNAPEETWCASTKLKYEFKGTYQPIASIAGKYYITADGSLVYDNVGVGLNPQRWYMEVTDRNGNPAQAPASGARMQIIVMDDDTDAIQTIDADTTSHAVIYDINGQRLAEPRQGLNIINGKKMILR